MLKMFRIVFIFYIYNFFRWRWGGKEPAWSVEDVGDRNQCKVGWYSFFCELEWWNSWQRSHWCQHSLGTMTSLSHLLFYPSQFFLPISIYTLSSIPADLTLRSHSEKDKRKNRNQELIPLNNILFSFINESWDKKKQITSFR